MCLNSEFSMNETREHTAADDTNFRTPPSVGVTANQRHKQLAGSLIQTSVIHLQLILSTLGLWHFVEKAYLYMVKWFITKFI